MSGLRGAQRPSALITPFNDGDSEPPWAPLLMTGGSWVEVTPYPPRARGCTHLGSLIRTVGLLPTCRFILRLEGECVCDSCS